jgi:phosphatidylglycerophosphate synthase
MRDALSGSEKDITKKQWNLSEIRKLTFVEGDEYITYRLAEKISPHVTWVFLRWNIAPNTITFLFIGCLILASFVLALRPRDGAQIVALLIVMSYILDCSDGPVARATGRTSTVGHKLDFFGHWVTNNLLILGATLGEIGAGGSNSAWLVGMVALIGTNNYYFMQFSLLPHSLVALSSDAKTTSEDNKSQSENDTSLIRRLRNAFRLFAPLDTNLLLFTSLVGLPFLAIQIWAVISNVATLAIFGQYYWRETR